MGKEIERRFLVDIDKWKEYKQEKGLVNYDYYRQGYIHNDTNKIIRIRMIGVDEAYLTIKGERNGMTVSEFEYKIPYQDAQSLLDEFSNGKEIQKFRYKVHNHQNIWEVDEFLSDNEGLIIAELELESEDEMFIIPDWCSEEVTGDWKYYNALLIENPYKFWK